MIHDYLSGSLRNKKPHDNVAVQLTLPKGTSQHYNILSFKLLLAIIKTLRASQLLTWMWGLDKPAQRGRGQFILFVLLFHFFYFYQSGLWITTSCSSMHAKTLCWTEGSAYSGNTTVDCNDTARIWLLSVKQLQYPGTRTGIQAPLNSILLVCWPLSGPTQTLTLLSLLQTQKAQQ